MDSVNPTKTELDVLDFGTLCHAALEGLGCIDSIRDSQDVALVRSFLLDRLQAETSRRYGSSLTLPLVVQLESARQRLSRAAELHVASRADGWILERVEQSFELKIGELRVTGKIDRIDRHERSGQLRVIDYKTSDRAVDPRLAHVRPPRRGESVPDYTALNLNGRDYVWTDLQLPLYAHALRNGNVEGYRSELVHGGAVGAAPVICGYFNLPKAGTETGIRLWEDYTADLHSRAWECAHAVAAAIVRGEFWPPNEAVREQQDPFASLFHHGVSDSVDWTCLQDPQLTLGFPLRLEGK